MKNILIGVTVLLIVGMVVFYLTKVGNNGDYKLGSVDNSFGQNSEVSTTTNSASVEKEKTYTLSDIVLHNSETSCWSVVNNKVYDLTSWISKHPGGSKAIISICGKDGTTAFSGQHEGDSKPEEKLATFYIGILTQ